MNKVYSGLKGGGRIIQRMILMAFLVLGMTAGLQAQNVRIESSGGNTTPTLYPTLKAAFDAINAGTHQGNISVWIVGNTTETASAVLNASGAPSQYNSVVIKPETSPRTISGNISTALIKLNGADNVVIDGSLTAGTRDLTISNLHNDAGSSSSGIWVASAGGTNGATDNVVMNCIVQGLGQLITFNGIVQSSGTTIGGVAEAPNSNNLYANNEIYGSEYGIALVGKSSTEYDIENTITANIIGGATGNNRMGYRGIFLAQQFNVSVSDNIISNILRPSGTGDCSGIYVGGPMSLGVIERNKISNIEFQNFWGANGIHLNSSSATTDLVIQNNFISNIAAGGFSGVAIGDNPYGIAIASGGGYKLYYNSIDSMYATGLGSGSSYFTTSRSAALWIDTDANISGLDIRNNIFSNRGPNGPKYAILNRKTGAIFTTINHNNYYSSQPNVLGESGGSPVPNITAWRAATGQDVNSLSANPFFFSVSDLHLQGMSPMDAQAQPIAGITTDIDGQPRHASTPDIGADEFTPPNCSQPANGGTITSSATELCGNGTATLSALGYSFGIGSTYQWERSFGSAAGPYSSIGGQNNPLNGNTGVLTTGTWYFRLRARCNAGVDAYSNVISVIVNNPVAVGTGGTRCGVGTVNLSATGTNIRWYDVPTGGSALGTGPNFTTPQISANTTFYAAASSGGVFLNGGKPTPATTGTYTQDAGLRFDALQAFTIIDVTVYPTAAGTIRIQVINSAGAVVGTNDQTFTVPASPTTGVVLPLNFTVPVGTDYRLIRRGTLGIPMKRDLSPNAFPYSLAPAANIVGGVLGTTGSTNGGVYYYFFDWNITTSCEGTRVPVVASVTAPPAVSVAPAAGPSRTICSGNSITLTASSGNGGYVYTWNPGSIPGNAITVSPTSTTTYTLIADDGTCRNDQDITVTVNNTPSALTITPSTASVCANFAQSLVANGGLIPDQTLFEEKFNTIPITKFTLAGTSSMTATRNTTYFQEGTASMHLNAGNSLPDPGAGVGFGYESQSLNLTGITNPRLSFWHIAALEGSATSNFDFGRVEYSTNGGTTWTTFPSSTYMGAGAVYGGTVSFNQSSYPDWNSQFNAAADDPGPPPAADLWKQETLNLDTWAGTANFKVRFRLKMDVSVIYYGWLIDNVRISGTALAPTTWSPNTNLFMDLAHTIPYTGQTTGTVYFYSTVTTAPQVYTATAVGGVGCTRTATATISATNAVPSVSITPLNGTSFCKNQEVAFQAVPVNGGSTPAYQFYINGTPYFPTAHPDSIITRFAPGVIPNGANITVRMIGPAIPPCPAVNVLSPAVNITVYDTSVVSITGPATVCSDAPIILTANATGSISTYEWFRNGTPIGTNSNTLSVTQFGDYTVRVTTTDGCATTSAIKTVGQNIWSVDIQPGPNGTINPPGPVLSVPCGDSVTFTVIPNPGYNILDVLIDGISILNIVTPGGPYTFSPTVDAVVEAFFGISGCGTPATAFAGNNTAICASQATYLLSSQGPNIGGTATSATWSTSGSGTFNGGGVFGTATTYTPSAADTAAGSVTITLTTNDPPGTCIASTSSFLLTLTPSPIVTISGTPGFCTAGATSTLLTANASFAAGTITGYQWYRGATPVGTGPTYNANIAGNYSVVVSGDNGCSGTGTLTVVAFTAPSVTITGTPFFCEGGFTDLSADVVLGSGTVGVNAFQWEFDDVPAPATFFPVPGANQGFYNVTTIGRYRVIVTDDNGCQSTYSPIVNVTYDQTPMAGLYTIGMGPASCTNFISYASAVEALNTRSISDDVTIEAPADYSEVVPVGGLKLGSPVLNDSTRIYGHSITFTKSGSGENPKLVAYANATGTFQANSATPDGIWALVGVDNVTIEQVDLEEDLVNNIAGPGPLMEYGFAIFKRTINDGAKNNTIQNCNITLSRDNTTSGIAPMSNGSTGILVANSTVDAAVTSLVPGTVNGLNSGNKFYTNVIREVNTGIALNGYDAPSPFNLGDQGNDIGGSLPETGNQIINFGRNVLSGGAPSGISTSYQWGLNISHNTINNNDGTGSNSLTVLRGIMNDVSQNANATISFNTITIESGSITANSTYGIDTKIGNLGTNNTVSILNNNIQVKNLVLPNIPNVSVVGIFCNYTNLDGPSTLQINNNNIHDLRMVNNSTSNAVVYGIQYAAITNVLSVSGNTINNLSKSTGGGNITTPLVAGFFSSGSAKFTSATIDNNVFSNFTINGGGVATTLPGAVFTNWGTSYSFSGNQINNLSITGMSGTAAGTLYGVFIAANAASSGTELIQGNTVHDLTVAGTSSGLHILTGMATSSATTSSVRTLSQNTVYNIYTHAGSSGTVSGIWSVSGFNVNIRRNYVHSIFAGQNTSPSTVRGIYQSGNVLTNTVANNMVSLDLTQAIAPASGNQLTGANSLIGIDISTGNTAGWTTKLYYNTVRVAGTGAAATFGGTALNFAPANNGMDLRNNIFANYLTPGASGFATAMRRPGGALTASYNTTSNNNLFYTAQTASAPLYLHAATPYVTLADFKTFMGATRESASVADEPIFVDVAVNNLHIDPNGNCTINGGAQVIAGFDRDIDDDARDASTPDIGADEFLGLGGAAYVWKGINTNWEDAANWCPKVPDASSNVTIPNAVANYPILTTNTNTARNITIDNGGSITINVGATLNVKGPLLTVEGNLTNNGTLAFNAGAGVAQAIPTGGGTIAPMNILQVANTAGFTLHRDITILGELRPTSGNITLNDTVTLRSTVTGTAQVSALGGGVVFAYGGVGKFVVENYIHSDLNKSWRFISAPIGGSQTINQAWQEGEAPGVYTVAGFGMQMIGPASAGPGYDMENRPTDGSLKKYNPAINNWVFAPGTLGPVSALDGYMAYIRGDRLANVFGAHSNTTLRVAGPIKTGNVVVNGTGVNQFISVANPYPSAIDYTVVTKNNLSPFFYVWDPVLGVDGGWQTIAIPSGNVTPGGGSYTSNTTRIESGQAFMAYSTNAVSSLTITEASKVNGSNLVTRVENTGKILTTKLYQLNDGVTHLTDGTRAEFDASFTSEVNYEDAQKAGNFGESIGIATGGKVLSVERRPEVVITDTIHYTMGQLRRQQYQLELIAQELEQPGLEAFLEDTYLETRVPVSLAGSTTVTFEVDNNAASGASNRFRLVFRVLAPVPVTFISVDAVPQVKDIRVRFRVENEVNIRNYTVERSVNGRVFAEAGSINANNSAEYNFTDVAPGSGTFFYRIRSNGFDASDVKYSQVAFATIGGDPSMITIYPNPVKEDRQVKVSMVNQEKGVYTAILRNHNGQVILQKKLDHAGGSALYTLDLSRVIVHGSYSLQIIDERRRKTIFKIVY